MAVNNSKAVTDEHVNKKATAPRPEETGRARKNGARQDGSAGDSGGTATGERTSLGQAGRTQAGRTRTSRAATSRAHTSRAQDAPVLAGLNPASTTPASIAPASTTPASPALASMAPAGTAPAGTGKRRPAWRQQRDLPIAGTRPSRSATAGKVVLAYLRLHTHELRALEPAVRADEYDAVHRMRVATRRLRAVLRSFGQVIPRDETAHLAGELKWLGQLLGAARDGEVLPAQLRDSLRPFPAELLIGPVQARVQGHFAPLRAAAHREVIEALDSPRYAQLLAELDLLATGPLSGPRAGDPARDVLPKAVRQAYRQADRRMRRARRTAPGRDRDVALHQARKSARRARYAAEAAAMVSGKPARRFARQMKKVQSVLGEHQDAVIARQSARDLGIGAHLAGENAFTYGLLHEHERHQAEHLQAAARKTWKKASRPGRLKWMK